MQNFIIRITQENANIAKDKKFQCYILPDSLNTEFVDNFTATAKQCGKLLLAQGATAIEFYKKHNLDGFIIDTVKDTKPQKTLKNIRQQAPNAIIGVISRNRRHEAMLVSECEPDFIIFNVWQDGLEHNRELLEWYSELFLIQSAVQCENGVDFTTLPADLVIIDDTELLTE